MPSAPLSIKPLVWIGRAKADLRAFPEDVKDSLGFALYTAQQGGKHIAAKPQHGFGGAGVLEIVERHDGDTYRFHRCLATKPVSSESNKAERGQMWRP
jgi:phage-related protein